MMPRRALGRAVLALALAAGVAHAQTGAQGPRLAQSRDSLFSDTPDEKEPAREPRFAWGGFFEETVAYTYSDPAHWSQAVSRLQLFGQGALAEGVRYKVSARVDVDPVYIYSDFYNAQVRANQRFNYYLRENYVDFSAGSLDFRLGRQQIVWGDVVGLFFADVVSARDTREFILPSFDIIRIPQWAARAEWFKGDFHAEAIWIPVRSFDEFGEAGADFYPPGRAVDPPPGVTTIYQADDQPSKKLANSNYGLRLSGLAAGWDLSAFYFRSYAAAPTFYRTIVAAPVPALIFSPRHDRIWQAGGTASKDFGAFVLRAETVYTSGQGYSTSSLTVPGGVVEKRTLEWILSLDFQPGRDTRVNVQAFQRHFYGGDEGIVPETGGYGASVLVSSKVTPTVEPSLLVIQGLSVNDRMVRPRVSWYFQRNWALAFGVDIFAGPPTGFFGRYANRDRVYAELRYNF